MKTDKKLDRDAVLEIVRKAREADEVPHLIGANLRGADLSEANLHWAKLIGANLIGATLCDATLDGALVTCRGKTVRIRFEEEEDG